MSESSSRTFLIIALIVFVLLVAWPVKLLLFAPVGVFNGLFHGHPFDRTFEWSWSWPWIGFAGFFALAALLVWIAIVVWIFKDAEKRGMSGILWALIVFFVHFIGLIIYFIVRADHPIPGTTGAAPGLSCPKCGKATSRDHTYCPSCGEPLQRSCPQCKKSVQSDWKTCPYCGQKL
jgi:RNA polymerase subunit RPABC4/transcription elongation factor Spt4/uncharacterized membrane protein YhaH (DUF805 family)